MRGINGNFEFVIEIPDYMCEFCTRMQTISDVDPCDNCKTTFCTKCIPIPIRGLCTYYPQCYHYFCSVKCLREFPTSCGVCDGQCGTFLCQHAQYLE
jgi:hypothetical protein